VAANQVYFRRRKQPERPRFAAFKGQKYPLTLSGGKAILKMTFDVVPGWRGVLTEALRAVPVQTGADFLWLT
jgi:hypothetical protein